VKGKSMNRRNEAFGLQMRGCLSPIEKSFHGSPFPYPIFPYIYETVVRWKGTNPSL